MKGSAYEAVAIVGVGAVLPDAPNARIFWENIKNGRYSITEVNPARWNPNLYYDPDPKAPDKTYSKIGGWAIEWDWDPLKWKIPMPPRVSQAMDQTQKWAVVTAREALADYGYPSRPLNAERTAVILGNAMAGDSHLYSAARVFFPEYAEELSKAPAFANLPSELRESIIKQMRVGVGKRMPEITEDTMPGELANIIAGRVAAIYDFKGPNFVADAACASAMAAITSAVGGLLRCDYDAVLTGGIDANMSPSTFVKFCKIGALSATGSRPYAAGSDGFVMGEGAVTFLLKRLVDAERDGDKIYAVIRGLGGSSDGKGKGITAPNPVGQRICVHRAWQNAQVTPSAGDMIEGHGTSTAVGDLAELQSLSEVFRSFNLPAQSIALGSVKSNIGHLKGAAGAAGILKGMFALHEKLLPPSLNFHKPNPEFDFEKSPFRVSTQLRAWEFPKDGVRHVGVSAFGFGGTNFHTVLEEYIPGRLTSDQKSTVSFSEAVSSPEIRSIPKAPMRGVMVLGAESEAALATRMKDLCKMDPSAKLPPPAPPDEADLRAPVRLAIDYDETSDLVDKAKKALKALEESQAGRWKALRAKGIFLGKGPAPKVAFLFTGQGSQYINMLQNLKEEEPIVAETFSEADRIMQPILGKSLSECIFLDKKDEEKMAIAEQNLKQTAITQPAVLTVETALARLIGSYGITPDMVMGHSLGEYGALVAAGSLPFDEALRAVCARGSEMAKCALDDNGMMAAVFGPVPEIQNIIAKTEGYVVVANINSSSEAVIGGETAAVEKAMVAVRDAGYVARPLQVSHAFHTRIVAKASEALMALLGTMNLKSPTIPCISNVTGDFHPMGPGAVPSMINLLGEQVFSPVQFVKGLNTLYDNGARIFVEFGPKRILYGFVEDVLGEREGVVSLFTNHPRIGDAHSVNQALCGLYAAGLGVGLVKEVEQTETAAKQAAIIEVKSQAVQPSAVSQVAPVRSNFSAPTQPAAREPVVSSPIAPAGADRYVQLGKLFVEFLDRGFQLYTGGSLQQRSSEIYVTGASLGLPNVDKVFDDTNVERILRGDQFIRPIPLELRQEMVDKNITRLVKSDGGEGRFETINHMEDVIKLAARSKNLDLIRDFGFPEERLHALDRVTILAIGAGIDALRDAGIPLVMRYKMTTKGTLLPDRWMLPEELRDDTGVLFTSAFPGYDSYEEIISEFQKERGRIDRVSELESLRESAVRAGAANQLIEEIDKRITALHAELEAKPYRFDRRFLFRVLSMGHSQFAEYIGARGPNTATNAACASGTQAVGIASDWIRTGRCRRVIIISADDVTSDNLMGWFGSGFLASGAAATDEIVEDAATPFDRRRHGLLIGMGASAIVLENGESVRERGLQPICELMGSTIANSAFHGTRLDVGHICQVMEKLISGVEHEWGVSRYELARHMVFVSHETYTPARGGSASAEVFALRSVFGDAADQIVIANTKGATGHPMAVGIEDVVSVKILETGIVPPVANFKEVDPDLGQLNLSKGGSYPVQYALRLGAGFGSQICMTLLRWIPTPSGVHASVNELGYRYRVSDLAQYQRWLQRVTGQEKPELEIVQRTLRAKDQVPVAQNGRAVTEAKAVPVVSAPLPAVTSAIPAQAIPAASSASGASGATAIAGTRAIDPVQVKVMQIISEKTGYPTDMLDLDLDLEADLGIDTVKQAEMFAAIREAYDIPREDTLRLRDFPTLAHAIKFVYDRRPDLKSAPAAEPIPVPPAPSATGAPASAMIATAACDDGVKTKVLQIIAEKTGYPIDMLDLDLDLEADLGIDTVKQAEMFAAIREAYDIPREDTLKLRDFPTLAHAIQFVYDRRPDLKPTQAAESIPAPVPQMTASAPAVVMPSAPAHDDGVKARVLQIIAEKTGYPIDMLDLDLDLEADLGIDTVKQAEMFAAIREAYNIPREDTLKLRDFPTLAHAIQFVYDHRPDLKPNVAVEAIPVPIASIPVAAVAEPVAISPEDEVKERVLRIIAEKTGYPIDMLDLDLDLEADLGIDTVKQAEMFAEIRAAYDIPRDDALKLRDFPTLAHTIQFVYDRRPDLKKPVQDSVPAAKAASQVIPAEDKHVISGNMEAARAIPRRVPVPVLRPPLNFCKASGVVINSNSRILVMSDKGGVGKSLVGRLAKLGADVLFIDDVPSDEEFLQKLEEYKSRGPIQGVYWLTALDHEGAISELDLASWRKATHLRVKMLYSAMRSLYDQIGSQGTFLVSATRLGGNHGYDEAGALAPMGGCVTGFVKAFKREKLKTLTKAVDFEDTRKTAGIADLLLDETLRDPGVVEVGYKNGLRWTITLEGKPLAAEAQGVELNKDTVFVISGAAGSIVSAITADLAAASGGIFHLLDLIPVPDPDNSDLKHFATDKEGLKRDIFERFKAKGVRATPVMVDKELAAMERSHAALAAIKAVKDAGGVAHYHSVNLLDAEAVAKVMKDIGEKSGKIDVLLHAAGMEISHPLPDKKPEEFNLVFDVKSDGWFNLLSNMGEMPLGSAVVFSSVAGRFGNTGQTDYSSANDLMCKYISSFRTTRPGTHGIAIDWTAWQGIGMASRGSIPTIMKQAGIDMLPPEAGIAIVRRELTAGRVSGEVVIAQGLGMLIKEFDESGGLDTSAGGPLQGILSQRGVMTGKVIGMGIYSGLAIETVLDPKQQPFLCDHQINGTPVLPGVMGIEALVESAKLLFPDKFVGTVEDVNFLTPFKFYRNEHRTLQLNANFRAEEKDIVAYCRLIGSRLLHGQTEPEVTTHFTAQVRLQDQPLKVGKRARINLPVVDKQAQADDIYRIYFHGPAYKVVESAWRSGDEFYGLYAISLPANHEPKDAPVLTQPRLIELCFQTASLWELVSQQRMGLPYRIEKLCILGLPPEGGARLFAVVQPSENGTFEATIADVSGRIYLEVHGYQTMQLPDPVDAQLLKPLQRVLE
jgi:acyl transferase domain-containing protein/acyl carrier protein/NAD(P)-dependent dehydrogenase (short-subunit alcohol dehydrogenase family)